MIPTTCANPECPMAGYCNGYCANFFGDEDSDVFTKFNKGSITLNEARELMGYPVTVAVTGIPMPEPVKIDEHIFAFTRYSAGSDVCLEMTCSCGVILRSDPGTKVSELLFREEFSEWHERVKE